MNIGHMIQKSEIEMKMLTDNELKSLHEVILEILDDLIEICGRYQLDYYFIGGSAIGALRHSGFIPWDNDIDIAMTRSDFEKLCCVISKEYGYKYSIINPKSKKNFGRVLSKMRRKGTLYQTILETDLEECGIFLDIYIIEATYPDCIRRSIHGCLCYFAGFTLACRRTHQKYDLYRGICGNNRKQKQILRIKNIYGLVLSLFSIEQIACWVHGIYGMCKNTKSKYISIPSDDLGFFFGNVFIRKDFCNPVYFEFEGRMVSLPGNYHTYLKEKYGNYMEIPNINKRKNPFYLHFRTRVD